MKLSQSPAITSTGIIHPHAGRVTRVRNRASRRQTPLAGSHGGTLPKRMSFLELDRSLVLSAMKRSDCGNTLLLRLFNPAERAVTGALKFFRPVRAAELVSLEETPLRALKPRGKRLALRVGSRKIVSVKITL